MPTKTATIKDGWQKLKLGEVIGYVADNRGKNPSYYSVFGIPVIDNFMITGTKNIDLDNTKRFIDENINKVFIRKQIIEGDLLVTLVGNGYGNLGLAPKNSVIIQNTIGLRCNEKCLNDYLFYNLTINKDNIKNLNRGAAQPSVKVSDLLNISIEIPPLETQKKIADVLGAYDDLIEVNQKKIKILENMAQTIYKEWFVKPVKNGLLNGWEIENLEKVTDVIKGRSYKSSEIGESGDFFFVNLKCFNRNGGFRHDGIKMYSGKVKDNQLLQTGDIIIAVTDMTQKREVIGRPAQLPVLKNKQTTFSCDVVKVEPKENSVVDKNYLYYSLRFSDFSNITKNKANGVNVLHLNPRDIEQWQIIIPPKDVQIKFKKIMNPVTDNINILIQEIDYLKNIRDLLIPQLVGGRVNLK